MTRSRLVAPVLVLALVLLAGSWLAFRGSGERHLTATFPSTISLYQGAKVKVLGVPVGTVDSVKVRGTSVRVRISYSSDVTLPRDVHAMIVPPSIVGDRFVQLGPAYASGPKLADGASVGLDHTGVPVELDDTYRTIGRLSTALGPKGANRDGALSRLVSSAAAAMQGNGRQANRTLRQVADALDTLAAADPDVQGTVRHSDTFMKTLARNDGTVRRLVLNLARVSAELNGQRDDIGTATKELSSALRDVAAFTKSNRGRITRNVADLESVTDGLTRRNRDLQDLLDLAPTGFVDAMNIFVPDNWDPNHPGASVPAGRTGSLGLRGNFFNDLGAQLSYVLGGVCDTVTGAQAARLAPFCTALAGVGGDFGQLLSKVSSDPSSLASTKVGKQ